MAKLLLCYAGDIRDTVLIIFYYENVETYRNIEIIVFLNTHSQDSMINNLLNLLYYRFFYVLSKFPFTVLATFLIT